MNESIHGLLIAHRLFESYNQEMNKRMNLPSYEIGSYSNDDLPENIFNDRDGQFFERSPNEIYRRLLSSPDRTSISIPTVKIISSSRNLNSFINDSRLRLGKLLRGNEIDQLDVIQEVYRRLENAAGNYDAYSDHIRQLEELLRPVAENLNIPPKEKQVYDALLDIHLDIKTAIRQIKADNQAELPNLVNKVQKEATWLKTCIEELDDDGQKLRLTGITRQIEELSGDLTNYLNSPDDDPEYSVYGKEYLFYNIRFLTKLNRYGNGYVSQLNQFFQQENWAVIYFLEEPHYLKITYPENSPRNLESNSKKEEPVIEKEEEEAPEEDITPRMMTLKDSYTVYVDSLVFNLEIHDHKIGDNDKVSINVNGRWLFTDVSLGKEPLILQLRIRPNQENQILILAENSGWKPPNTLGVRYLSKNPAKNVYIKSDLNASEYIQVRYRLQ